MAARENKIPKSPSAEARAFVVVLEEIRAQNRVFGEGQQLLQHDIAEIRHDIEEIRGQHRVFGEGQQLLQHDVAELRHDLGLVKIAVLDHARELKETRGALDKKVDRDEVEAIVHRVVARSG